MTAGCSLKFLKGYPRFLKGYFYFLNKGVILLKIIKNVSMKRAIVLIVFMLLFSTAAYAVDHTSHYDLIGGSYPYTDMKGDEK
ncbi:MAG: hypothetical protein JL50_20415 [Peptococcaceae bacterium BICA1-7]|nr:MAG: hypothetical protein JL50_20415 [Peptococcaceae bacterium BICA1-7]